ncbi:MULTISPECIES: (2Fe-2S)-binding protein [Streptomyces]|uniref:(2Fe-2S)-binding protein n=1 Tax=Streptomyces luteosporeus TaxID=173856 RepID=A0ABN3TUM3_9ACTN
MSLSELADVGPFFALPTGQAPPADDAAAYLPPGPEALRQRIAVVTGRLGTREERVAASLAFQGLAGRLLSITLGSLVLTGRAPDLAAGALRWHPALGAPDDLWWAAPAAPPPAQDAAAVLHEVLLPLHAATRSLTGVSARLLWGNAGSALAGALRVLHPWCLRQGRPADADRAVALTRTLLADPLLHDTGTLHLPAGGPAFARTTCCLYYRVPGGGLCGDCVLQRRGG